MMTITAVFGTIQETIKIVPMIRALRSRGHTLPVLVTVQHRDMLDQQMADLGVAADIDPDANVETVYPVHPTPNVQRMVEALLTGRGRAHRVSPLDFIATVQLTNMWYFLLADSSGVQGTALRLPEDSTAYRSMTTHPNPFGDGTAGEKTADVVEPPLASARV